MNESNYISLLKTEKGAYYQGETFDGSVILGRKGGAQKPNGVELELDGRKLTENDYDLIDGGIKVKGILDINLRKGQDVFGIKILGDDNSFSK